MYFVSGINSSPSTSLSSKHTNSERFYLSWKVFVRLLREITIVRRQMRHNIMLMRNPNCVWHKFTIVGHKSCITNSRLPEGRDMDVLGSSVDLRISI